MNDDDTYRMVEFLIRHICPVAPGWFAVYRWSSRGTAGWELPIACWAKALRRDETRSRDGRLVDVEKTIVTVGLVPGDRGLVPAEGWALGWDPEDFLGYRGPNTSLETWLAEYDWEGLAPGDAANAPAKG
jgi:hypothetical protein